MWLRRSLQHERKSFGSHCHCHAHVLGVRNGETRKDAEAVHDGRLILGSPNLICSGRCRSIYMIIQVSLRSGLLLEQLNVVLAYSPGRITKRQVNIKM